MALSKKHKLLLPLTIGAFAFLGWEAYQMMGGGDSSYTPPPIVKKEAVPKQSAPAPARQAAVPAPASRKTPHQTVSQTSSPPEPVRHESNAAPAELLTPAEKAYIAQQKTREEQYVQVVNAYQLAQMQKKLVDANAQLAQAKLQEAKTLAEISKSQSLGLGGNVLPSTGGGILSQYSVIYVSSVDGRWMATLRYEGRLHNVYVGSQFADGTSVRVIDRNGVVLQNGRDAQYVTIPLAGGVTGSGGVHAGTQEKPDPKSIPSKISPTPAQVNQKTADQATDIYHTLTNIQKTVEGSAKK